MSSLLQNLRRNMRKGVGWGRSKSCDRERTQKEDEENRDGKASGKDEETVRKSIEDGDVWSSGKKDVDQKVITQRSDARKVSVNSYVDGKMVSSNFTNRSMDDLRSFRTTPASSNTPTPVLPAAEEQADSRASKFNVIPTAVGRSSRPRLSHSGFTNGGTFEDSGVDLDSSQGCASQSSDPVMSPLHSRDSSHSGHLANSRVPNASAFVHHGRLLQTVAAKLSPDYMSMDGGTESGEKGIAGKNNLNKNVLNKNSLNNHARQSSKLSVSSSRSTNSSGSSSKSTNQGETRQHLQSPNGLSARSQSRSSQEEVYVKMNDFESERSHGSAENLNVLRMNRLKHSKEGNKKFDDREYVNLIELSRDISQNKKTLTETKISDPTSLDGDNRFPKKELSKRISPNGAVHNITVQVHSNTISQVQDSTPTSNQRQGSNHNQSVRLNPRLRKPISEESDLESNSESVTSQEVAVLTAISRRRRIQLSHKHASFPNSRHKGVSSSNTEGKGGINKSLASFAEQSILSFLSHLDGHSESESDSNTSARCEHATRKFLKTSPTPTNISSDAGGSPSRLDAATPTNADPSLLHPSLHQIVGAYDLVALTLSKTGYNYPHYGIHVCVRRLADYLSPSGERPVSSLLTSCSRSVSSSSSRNSSNVSKPSSLYTPPGGFEDTYMLPAVMAIDQDGVAGHDGRIRSGDYIIEVNGTSVLEKTAEETETLINSQDMVHLVTTRGRSAIR